MVFFFSCHVFFHPLKRGELVGVKLFQGEKLIFVGKQKHLKRAKYLLLWGRLPLSRVSGLQTFPGREMQKNFRPIGLCE